MLRVGLTGGLGSGKSTVAELLAQHGTYVLKADELGREMMQPGHSVFDQVVAHFGLTILTAEGQLNRPELARLAFSEGRVEELNAIVHPAVIRAQAEWMDQIIATHPNAVCVVESALIFETKHSGLRERFDRIILVTAPEPLRIQRFIHRMLPTSPLTEAQLEADAERRIAAQLTDDHKAALSTYVIQNTGSLETLSQQVDNLWSTLQADAAQR